MPNDLYDLLNMDEGDLVSDIELLYKNNYPGKVKVSINSINLSRQERECEKNLSGDRKKAYQILLQIKNLSTGLNDVKQFHLKINDYPEFVRKISQDMNYIVPSTPYSFSGIGIPISIIPRYLALKGGIESEIEKKGGSFWESATSIGILDKVESLDHPAAFLDVVGSFDPYVLLHDLFTPRYMNQMMKLPQYLKKIENEENELGFSETEKKLFDEKRREIRYSKKLMNSVGKFYTSIPENQREELRKNFESMVRKYFMAQNMTSIIHNSTPWHNKITSLINPETMEIGPRVIDIGSIYGWPSMYHKYADKKAILTNIIKDGYLWKRNTMCADLTHPSPPSLDIRTMEEGTLFGSVYDLYTSSMKYNLNRHEINGTIIDQLGMMSEMGVAEASIIRGFIKNYNVNPVAAWSDRKEDK